MLDTMLDHVKHLLLEQDEARAGSTRFYRILISAIVVAVLTSMAAIWLAWSWYEMKLRDALEIGASVAFFSSVSIGLIIGMLIEPFVRTRRGDGRVFRAWTSLGTEEAAIRDVKSGRERGQDRAMRRGDKYGWVNDP